MIVQQLVVILVFSQEGVRTRPSTLPSWFRLLSTHVVEGSSVWRDEEEREGSWGWGERERFIWRNCLMQLWRLRPLTVHHVQAGDPGKPVV